MRNQGICILFLLACVPAFAQVKPTYRFSPTRTLDYRLNISGTVNVQYGDVQQQQQEPFTAECTGLIALQTVTASDTVMVVQVMPRRTKMCVNEMTMEDNSASDTMPSQWMPGLKLELTPRGEILKITELSRGMISLAPFLRLLPTFPESGCVPGQPWKQSFPSFRLPLFPLPPLEFIYTPGKPADGRLPIALVAVPIIKAQLNQGGVPVLVTGRNASKATMIFNLDRGEIEQLSGVIDLTLRGMFQATPGTKKDNPPPLPTTCSTKMNFRLSQLPDAPPRTD